MCLLQSVFAIQLPVLQLQPNARDVVDREHATDSHQRRLRQSQERHRRELTANIPKTHVIWPSLHARTKTSGPVLCISCECTFESGGGGRCASAASAIPCNDLRRLLIYFFLSRYLAGKLDQPLRVFGGIQCGDADSGGCAADETTISFGIAISQ